MQAEHYCFRSCALHFRGVFIFPIVFCRFFARPFTRYSNQSYKAWRVVVDDHAAFRVRFDHHFFDVVLVLLWPEGVPQFTIIMVIVMYSLYATFIDAINSSLRVHIPNPLSNTALDGDSDLAGHLYIAAAETNEASSLSPGVCVSASYASAEDAGAYLRLSELWGVSSDGRASHEGAATCFERTRGWY